MYDELIKVLRETDFSDGCPCGAEPLCKDKDCVIIQSADAIEELSSQLDDFKRLCLPLKENRLYKYSDGSFVEVFLILPSEPPKEG